MQALTLLQTESKQQVMETVTDPKWSPTVDTQLASTPRVGCEIEQAHKLSVFTVIYWSMSEGIWVCNLACGTQLTIDKGACKNLAHQRNVQYHQR